MQKNPVVSAVLGHSYYSYTYNITVLMKDPEKL